MKMTTTKIDDDTNNYGQRPRRSERSKCNNNQEQRKINLSFCWRFSSLFLCSIILISTQTAMVLAHMIETGKPSIEHSSLKGRFDVDSNKNSVGNTFFDISRKDMMNCNIRASSLPNVEMEEKIQQLLQVSGQQRKLKTTIKPIVKIRKTKPKRFFMKKNNIWPSSSSSSSSSSSISPSLFFFNFRGGGVSEPIPLQGRKETFSSLSSSSSSSSSYPSRSSSTLLSSSASTAKRTTFVYIFYVLEAIGGGMAGPLLPFVLMGMGANAMMLGSVLAVNYCVQTIGCITMGRISDRYGRRIAVLGSLTGTTASFLTMSYATNPRLVMIGRSLGAICGGLTPIASTCIADVTTSNNRPRYLGYLQACTGIGFVIGPAIVYGLKKYLHFDLQEVLRVAALFPLCAIIFSFFFLKETHQHRVAIASTPSLSSSTTTTRTAFPTEQGKFEKISVKKTGKRNYFSRSSRASIRNQNKRPLSTEQVEDDGPETDSFDLDNIDIDLDKTDMDMDIDLDVVNVNVEVKKVDEMRKSKEGKDLEMGKHFKTIQKRAQELPTSVDKGFENQIQGEHEEEKKGGIKSMLSFPVRMVILNGFIVMWAFASECIYGMFLRDVYNYDEGTLSLILAMNGVMVGVMQVAGVARKLFDYLGKHNVLMIGNFLLGAGMCGLSLIHFFPLHLLLFSVHIVGYSLADTAVSSLMSHYSPPELIGSSLGILYAGNNMARMLSPLVAGALYEISKNPYAISSSIVNMITKIIKTLQEAFHLYGTSIARNLQGLDTSGTEYVKEKLAQCLLLIQNSPSLKFTLPFGSLPYLAASFFPLVATSFPGLILLWERKEERRILEAASLASSSKMNSDSPSSISTPSSLSSFYKKKNSSNNSKILSQESRREETNSIPYHLQKEQQPQQYISTNSN